ncbi:MAG: sigma-70 family RNA polymerase sigma factor [Burkholderiaceae bacterium]|jgi:RNA polymerase sigma-70 factor (ECF subfamily)
MLESANKYTELAKFFRAGLAGDQAAYTQFLRRIVPVLRAMTVRSLPASDVDDVVQDILMSIHKARHTYDGERPLLPWLTSIVRFRVSDHLRRHYAARLHQMIDIDAVAEFLPDVTGDGDQREYIDDMLDTVAEQQKQILTLMHVEGYTAREVGQRMKMNESAVKVAAHRAIKKIRKQFGL